MSKNLLIGIMVVAVLIFVAWFLYGNNRPGSKTQTGEENITSTPSTKDIEPSGSLLESTDSSMTEQVKEFKVKGSSFKFEPAEVKVNKGDTVKITFVNGGGFHDFVIDEFNIKTIQGNGPSEEIVTFVAGKAGEFPFYCSVGQHRSLGMEGKLIVE